MRFQTSDIRCYSCAADLFTLSDLLDILSSSVVLLFLSQPSSMISWCPHISSACPFQVFGTYCVCVIRFSLLSRHNVMQDDVFYYVLRFGRTFRFHVLVQISWFMQLITSAPVALLFLIRYYWLLGRSCPFNKITNDWLVSYHTSFICIWTY